jgi:hypothetical protein
MSAKHLAYPSPSSVQRRQPQECTSRDLALDLCRHLGVDFVANGLKQPAILYGRRTVAQRQDFVIARREKARDSNSFVLRLTKPLVPGAPPQRRE